MKSTRALTRMNPEGIMRSEMSQDDNTEGQLSYDSTCMRYVEWSNAQQVEWRLPGAWGGNMGTF